MRQNILGDCSSENICSLMKSVRFVGLFPVCAWLYFVNSVDLSSQTLCFCWIHGGGGGDGTTCWGPFLVAHFIEPETLKLNKCNLVSSRWKRRNPKLVVWIKILFWNRKHVSLLVRAPMNHHTPCKMDNIVDRNFSTVLCSSPKANRGG